MLNILFGVILAAALLNGFLFGGSLFWSLLAAILSLGLLVFRLAFAGKFRPSLIRLVSLAGLVFLLLAGSYSGLNIADASYLHFGAEMDKAEKLLNRGEFYDAGSIFTQLEKTYGTNDQILLGNARVALGKKEYPLAETLLSMVANKKQQQYYITLGQCYAAQGKYEKVQDVFVEAAGILPFWSKAQRLAGTQAAINKDYAVGEYFLLRANEQLPDDPIPLYYLGVIRYEQGNFTEAEGFFAEAQALGLDSDLSSYVAWYRQEMGGDQT